LYKIHREDSMGEKNPCARTICGSAAQLPPKLPPTPSVTLASPSLPSFPLPYPLPAPPFPLHDFPKVSSQPNNVLRALAPSWADGRAVHAVPNGSILSFQDAPKVWIDTLEFRVFVTDQNHRGPSKSRPLSSLIVSPRRPCLPRPISMLETPCTSPQAISLQMAPSPMCSAIQVRGGRRRATLDPSHLVRKRRHGFLARNRSKSGRKVLLRRRLKHRKSLTH
jgi:large subunit ribosomal protein L34